MLAALIYRAVGTYLRFGVRQMRERGGHGMWQEQQHQGKGPGIDSQPQPVLQHPRLVLAPKVQDMFNVTRADPLGNRQQCMIETPVALN